MATQNLGEMTELELPQRGVWEKGDGVEALVGVLGRAPGLTSFTLGGSRGALSLVASMLIDLWVSGIPVTRDDAQWCTGLARGLLGLTALTSLDIGGEEG